MTDRTVERRRRLTRRALPALFGVAVLALTAGAWLGSMTESGAERTARDFGRAWERGDYAAMHELLTPDAAARVGLGALTEAYRSAASTATATRFEVGDPRGEDAGLVRLPVAARTRVFGVVRGHVRLPVEDERVAWEPHLAFPELERGERLERRGVQPERGRILARGGEVLAEGPASARRSPLGAVATEIAGRLEPEETAENRADLYARGFRESWSVGRTGLERVFDRELTGRPGGELLAGDRVLARAMPRPGRTVRTTIDVRLQEAAVTALAGRFGGVAVLDARNGAVRALAGIAFSAPQPPGSTFKIVTAAAALEAGLVKPDTEFPVQTEALIDGVPLENAHGESCGGSFRNSFAHSCNSVFAPLGVQLGAQRLVATAERFGWNAPPTVRGELPSTIPPAREIRTPLEVGSSAIGQGRVLATPLRLASAAQAIAAGGARNEPSVRLGRPGERVRVTSPRVARTLTGLMVDVVAYGTGIAAAIPEVKVAGKTGTAELEDTRGVPGEELDDPTDTDAWFVAFAPAERPRVVVAVLLVRNGAGGETAAPAARTVLAAALGKT